MDFIEYILESSNVDLFEEASESTSKIIVDTLYPTVNKVLSTPEGDRKFKAIIGSFIDRNGPKLHTAGPQYNIPFTEKDKADYLNLFGFSMQDLKLTIKQALAAVNNKASFQIVNGNPIYAVFYCVIRFYAIKKDGKSLNLALAAFALSMYPMVFWKYFKYGANEATMQYTIDHLSNKFNIKKTNHIFGLLMGTIQQCFKFHEKFIITGTDVSFVNFTMRVKNAFNSALKKIASEFYNNYSKGLAVHVTSDEFEDNAVVDVDNDSNKVEGVTDKIVSNLLTVGLDLKLAEMAAKGCGCSISDTRTYLNKILTTENPQIIRSFIESIIFVFMYQSHKSAYEINSKAFLEFCLALYKKTNSADKNIGNIKKILDKWSDVVGLTKSFSNLGTLNNYRRAIYMFFVLAIQKYN